VRKTTCLSEVCARKRLIYAQRTYRCHRVPHHVHIVVIEAANESRDCTSLSRSDTVQRLVVATIRKCPRCLLAHRTLRAGEQHN
jgi:hypothetical protein